MPDARCTRDLMRNVHKECAHEHTGEAENIRHSLRNGFTAYNELSPVSRSSLATVAPGKLVSPELDASISGVRTTRFCRTLSHRSLSALPASTATRPTFANDHDTPL